MSETKILCALCGEENATSREHVPPQSIFSKPRPSDLITVPACDKCNNGTSTEDEKFKAYLSLHVGIDNPDTEKLWSKHAVRTLKHNNRLRNAIVSTMRIVDVRAPSGIITGRATGVLWDSTAHRVVIEKLIRGLYYLHSGNVLKKNINVKTQWLRWLPKGLPSIETWPGGSAGGDAFRYKYILGKESSDYSMWIFCFYGKHWASGYTEL